MHLSSGEAVQHSTDVFAPDGIDLQVRRDLEIGLPGPLVRAVAPLSGPPPAGRAGEG